VAEIGEWVRVDIADDSVIVVRGRDGVIRSFFNTCRHRGSLVCHGESGHAPRLVCPYHQWSYHLDRSFAGIVHEHTTEGGNEWRLVRIPFTNKSVALTIDGTAASSKLLGSLDERQRELGSVRLLLSTNTWNHVQGNHVVSFSVLPIGDQQPGPSPCREQPARYRLSRIPTRAVTPGIEAGTAEFTEWYSDTLLGALRLR
jgi:phenylpropionate dioxygenase-like ring-hydroxylating dioxygenase large terminal subunit